jgi:signal transduction histidine kinase
LTVLSGIRLRLTLLYLLVGMTFLVLVSVGSYILLRDYYATSTDLALQHRLVEELQSQGAAIPPDLAAADRAWYASRGRSAPTSPAPVATRVVAAPPVAGPVERESDDADEGEDADEDEDRGEGEDRSGDGGQGEGEDRSGDGGHRESDRGQSGEGVEEEKEEDAEEHAMDDTYDGDLAVIFQRPLSADGRVLALDNPSPGAGIGPAAPSSLTSTDAVTQAVSAALAEGVDWRTVTAPDGASIRLLTYRLAAGDGSGPSVLQLGRPLADQERVLRRLLAVLLGLGAFSAVMLGLGGWWLAGRSLRPAEQAFRQQQAFVANASHELRTPLTLIRATTEVLARSLPPSGDHRPLLDDILAECDHTSRLVSDLLLLSRLDSGGLDLRREPVPLDALCADLARQFGRLAEQKGVTFTIDGAAGVALADPTRLRQVLLALLDNALRHTPAGGTIRLEARQAVRGEGRRADRRATIAVADTGSGIAPEHLPHVFERFYRADSSRGAGGAGLGLAVAKALVETQGGDIRVESEPGRGTRVVIGLPEAGAS